MPQDTSAGEWRAKLLRAREGLMLCQTHGYRLLAWPGIFLQAVVAAARGDDGTARDLADRMAGWAALRGVRSVQNYAWHRGGRPAGPRSPPTVW